ncbi:Chitin synthase A [Fusarium odoratissimum]|uniref:chitin synthase n=1 Tax=Fusarium oxysporum f. sp. cubense (strain race 4) TaxID=2502994 RepID=N1R849_FUSC4|nr:Chitin synthase A [Fusarium odoratissimum]
MEKLRSSLEAHKSALELALDMISLSLTKDIKVDTTEIRNDTTAIKDDTALILQEIAQLQARLPDTVASPNDYILQKFLEHMATYTETTLDVDVSYSDGMSSRALSIVDEHYHSSPKSPRYDLPILGPQYPAALVASQSSDSSNPDSRIEETQNQIAPSLVRVHQGDSHKKSVLSEFARLDTFDPLWRERYGDYLHGKRLSNDAIRENQERPIPTEEDDIVKLSYSTKGLSSQEEYHIQRFRGNVVVDLPVPDRILNLVPHSSPPGRDEFTHSRFSFITCPPEVFGNRNYTLRATLFAQPRQTQFILVMQLDPNDKDFVLRWNFIHDSIVYAQQKHQASGTSQEFWKRVIVHLHLAHGTQWGARSSDHPLNVLESIGAKQTINAKVTRIDSEYLDEPIEEGSSTIGGHMVHAIMSEYTVQLRQLGFPPGTVVPAEVPIQVVITSARAPENFPTLHWSNKFIPWTCAINEAVQAQHVIDMSEFSDALLTETNFLWEVLRRDRSLLVSKP